VFHHDDVIRIRGVEGDAQHAAADFVKRVAGRRAEIWAVGRVGVHVDVIAILEIEVARGLRVHVKLVLAHVRQPFIDAIRVAEVRVPNQVPIHVRPRGVDAVP
jgi:hypothetical protein